MALALTIKAPAATTTNAIVDDNTSAMAQEYRHLVLSIQELNTDLQLARAALLKAMEAERFARIRGGEDNISIKITTPDGHKVLVVYAEKYKHLDTENVPELKACFGGDYPLVCQEHEVVSFVSGAGLTAIETAIGPKAAAKLKPLLKVKASVTPRKGAPAQAAKYFRDGATDLGEDVLILLGASQYAPQVRAK